MLRKFVSGLLVVGILFCCVPMSVAELANNVVPAWLTELVGEHSYQSRLPEFESSANMIGFLRSDGAKTVYIFNQNIRTLAERGVSDENMSSAQLTITETSIPNVSMADAFVSSARPTACFGNQTVAYIGSHDVYDACRMFVKFTGLSSLEIDYNKVISAYYHITDNNSSTRSEIEAYYVTEDWNESAVTWNTMPDYDGTEIITTLNFPNVHGEDITDFYITQAVKGWLQGLPSYGILLKDKDDEKLTKCLTRENSLAMNYLAITYYDEANEGCYSENNREHPSRLGTAGIVSGEYYYIYNKNSGLFLTANSNSANAGIYQNAFNQTHLQQWKLVYNVTDEYYTLSCGTTGLNLQVSGTTASNGKLLKTATPSTGQNQRWKIQRNWDGSYQIASVINIVYVVSIASASTNDNAFAWLYQHTVDYSKEDDWTIIPVQKKNASVYYYSDQKIESGVSYTVQMKNYFSDWGFSAAALVDVSMQDLYSSLVSQSIVMYKGHGEEGKLCQLNNKGSVVIDDAYLVASNSSDNKDTLYALSELQYNQLSDLQLFMSAGCLSGRDGFDENTNLIGVAYDRGAHFACAPLHEVYYDMDGLNGEWWMMVTLALSVGKDIYTALADADEYLYGIMNYVYNNQNSRHAIGDNSLKIVRSATSNASQSSQINNVGTRIKSSQFPSLLTPLQKEFYKDSGNNVYQIKSTGEISCYIADLERMAIGNTVVDQSKALATTQQFLEDMGIDSTNYTVTHSNAYSKTFRASYENQTNRISFTLKADEQGEVYITHYFNTDKEVVL